MEIEDRGNEDHPVERDTLIAKKLIAQGRGPGRAVAFPGNELGAEPAIETRGIEPDEIADALHIGIDAPELFRIHSRRRPAKAGADRIDEHQIGRGQPGAWIFHNRIRRRRRIAMGVQIDPPRPRRPHLQPHRRRPRPSIKHKRNRPILRRGRRREFFVTDEKHIRNRLIRVIMKRQMPRPSAIFEHAAIGKRNLPLGSGNPISGNRGHRPRLRRRRRGLMRRPRLMLLRTAPAGIKNATSRPSARIGGFMAEA